MSDELRRGPSGPIQELTTGQIINTSELPGLTLDDALDSVGDAVPAGAVPLAPSGAPGSPYGPGYVSRRIFVDPASTKLGVSFMGVLIEAIRNFTNGNQLGLGNVFHIGLAAAGASGSNGSRATGAFSGGWTAPGGGGGSFMDFWLSRADLLALIAAGNCNMVAPLGGAAVPGVSSAGAGNTVNVAGNNPSGPTTLGPYKCFPGGGGNTGAIGATRAGGAGGGWNSAGQGGATSALNTQGGAPEGGLSTPLAGSALGASSIFGGAGCQANAGTVGRPGGSSVYGGGAGGVGGQTSTDPRAGGASLRGAGGGGSGEGANGAAGGTTAGAGGSTGNGFCAGGSTGGQSTGPGAGARVGSDGQSGADTTNVWVCCGAGGQGGGSANSTNNASTGGSGGDGGFPGGASGGGGTAVSQTGGFASTSGASGKGADALIIMDGYL